MSAAYSYIWHKALATRFVQVLAILNGLSAWRVRAQDRPFRLAVPATLCYPPALAIFIIWTLPADQTTADWTSVRADWELLRLQWE